MVRRSIDDAPVRLRVILTAVMISLAGCGTAHVCGDDAMCPKGGSFKFCGDQYLASDGSTFDCASSTDCKLAMTNAAAWCQAH